MSVETEISRLEPLGYSQYFESVRTKYGIDPSCLARVIAEHKGAYEITGLDGERRATVSGRFMLHAARRMDYPAVGDWVVIDRSQDTVIIESILPRRTVLSKKYSGTDEEQLIAANVDVAFIVESMDRDYSLNRFERYVVLAREGGVQPVIVLNKADLLTDNVLAGRISRITARFPGVDSLRTSTVTADGLRDLSGYIQKGATYCFLGSSGVGKSSIINLLLGRDIIKTDTINTKTDRGRHTTTAREMYFMDNGGIIIDNPGSRGVGVVDFSAGAVEGFAEIERLAAECRFRNCSHLNERGCAVLAAIASGTIDADQYENYRKLHKEAEYYEMSDYERHQKDKRFGAFLKNAKADIKKFKPR